MSYNIRVHSLFTHILCIYYMYKCVYIQTKYELITKVYTARAQKRGPRQWTDYIIII